MAEPKKHGWFTLSRELLNDKMWLAERFSKGQAWADLIGLAMFKAGEIEVRGCLINIERGQVGYSQESLAKRWKWSRNKVKRFLNYLETAHQITQHNEHINKYLKTVITITNYDLYQEGGQLQEQLERRLRDNSETSDDTVLNNDNKENKENNSINAPKSPKRKAKKAQPVADNPPEFMETCVFCDEQSFSPDYIDPKELWDFYVTDKDQGREWTYKDGKPILNWKSLYRNIHNSNKKNNKKVNAGYVQDQGKNPSEGYGRMGEDYVQQAEVFPPNRHPDDPIARHEAMADVEEVVTSEKGNVYVRRGTEWFDHRDARLHPAYYDPENEDYDEDCACITNAVVSKA